MAVNMTAINKDLTLWTAAADGKIRGFDKAGSTPLDVRAFPGAEGRAALTRGAAGYTGTKSLAFVDNLNDSGAGSLRAAIEGTGKEGTFVIFRTSGIIELATRLDCLSDYITVAGQTSPSGFCTEGSAVQFGSDATAVSDIIVRHCRFRPGYQTQVSGGTVAPEDSEGLRIWKANNVMIDHCSISWAGDENSSATTYNDGSVYDLTWSYCLNSQGLTSAVFPDTGEGNHGYGLLFNGSYHNSPENGMDVHHCIFAHFNDRTPQLSGAGRFNVVNNIVYNPYASQGVKLVAYDSVIGQDSLFVNYTNNYVIPGIATNDSINDGGNAAEITLSIDSVAVTPWDMLFMENNYGVQRLADVDPEWQLSENYSGALASTDWQSLTKFSITGGVAVTETTLTAATLTTFRDALLADVGATIPSSDAQDVQTINEVSAGGGSLLAVADYSTNPEIWPTYGSASYPTDTAGDGIPDAWWVFRNVTPATWDDVAPSGYLWIEEFLNDLADGSYSYA